MTQDSHRSPPATAPVTSAGYQRWLVLLAAVALWSVIPPYLGDAIGLTLDVPTSTETVDHALPGASAFIAAVLALLLVRRGESDSAVAFGALAVCALGGLFQTVTHVSLVLDAGDPLRPIDAVVWHATPGPVLLALSLWLLLRPLPDASS